MPDCYSEPDRARGHAPDTRLRFEYTVVHDGLLCRRGYPEAGEVHVTTARGEREDTVPDKSGR